ncbi:MAG: hypothetical protein ACRDNB_11085, partial [Gaiellaceae bacterium]
TPAAVAEPTTEAEANGAADAGDGGANEPAVTTPPAAPGNGGATPAPIVETPPDTRIVRAPTTSTTDKSATFAFTSSVRTAEFECSLDGAPFRRCATPVTLTRLPLGRHTFAVRAIDGDGKRDPTPARHAWLIAAERDVTPPETRIAATPAATTSETTATFEFTSSEIGSSFACSLDGAAFTSCAGPTTYTALAAGEHTFSVRATDIDGNTDATPASHTWTVAAATGPQTHLDSWPGSGTTSTDATFTFHASGRPAREFSCSLDGGAFALCASPITYVGLSVGTHTFAVRATDNDGQTDATPATHTWTIAPDTTPPETVIENGPAASTTSVDASFAFAGSEPGSLFLCALDGGAFTACISPFSYTGLALGPHVFQVFATDVAGNADATPAEHAWTITP